MNLLAMRGTNERVNSGVEEINEGISLNFEGINKGIKNDLLDIFLYLQENPNAKHADIKRIIAKSDATVERYLKILKDNGV